MSRLTELPPSSIWSFFGRYKLVPSLLLQFPCLKHQLILLKRKAAAFPFLEPWTDPCIHNAILLKWAVMSAWVHVHWIKTTWKRTVPGWCVGVGSVLWVCWCWALPALCYCILWDGEDSCWSCIKKALLMLRRTIVKAGLSWLSLIFTRNIAQPLRYSRKGPKKLVDLGYKTWVQPTAYIWL